MVLRVFERLVGLREGTLVADRDVGQPVDDDARDRGRPRIQRAGRRGGPRAGRSRPRSCARRGGLHEDARARARRAPDRDPAVGARPRRRDRGRDGRADPSLGGADRRRPRWVDRGAAEQPCRDRAAAAGHPARRRRIGRGRCRARQAVSRAAERPGSPSRPMPPTRSTAIRTPTFRARRSSRWRSSGCPPCSSPACCCDAASRRDRQAAQCRGPTPPVIASATDAALLVPEGTRLVHIGPFKTGTTSLQAAFHAGAPRCTSRASITRARTPSRSARSWPRPAAPTSCSAEPRRSRPGAGWSARSRRRPSRGSCVSSEFFSDAPPEAIRRIVDDLDPSRVHIVVTLRPLARIIPSQWQQFVQGGTPTAFDAWLRTTFDGTGRRIRRRCSGGVIGTTS